MTARGWTVLTFGVGLGGTGLLAHYPAFIAVGVWAAGAVLVAAVLMGIPVRLAAQVDGPPPRVPRDFTGPVVVKVHNAGSRTVRGVVLDAGPDRTQPLPALRPGAERVVEFTARWPERGERRFGPVLAVRTDPLGLVRRVSDTGAEATVLVVPVPVELRGGAVAASRHSGAMSGRLFDGSVEFESLREYVPGDDLRRMHWPSSQRTGKRLVRTFVDVATPSCTVVLDGDPAAYANPAAQDAELAVDAAASVARVALRSRQLVRLWAGGPPGPADLDGAEEFDRILDRLARWTPDHGGALAQLTAGIHSGAPGGDLVVLTGLRDTGQLGRCHGLAPAFRRAVLIRLGTADSSIERDGRIRILSAPGRLELAELWGAQPDPKAGAWT